MTDEIGAIVDRQLERDAGEPRPEPSKNQGGRPRKEEVERRQKEEKASKFLRSLKLRDVIKIPFDWRANSLGAALKGTDFEGQGEFWRINKQSAGELADCVHDLLGKYGAAYLADYGEEGALILKLGEVLGVRVWQEVQLRKEVNRYLEGEKPKTPADAKPGPVEEKPKPERPEKDRPQPGAGAVAKRPSPVSAKPAGKKRAGKKRAGKRAGGKGKRK